jgi:hypothetical protein
MLAFLKTGKSHYRYPFTASKFRMDPLNASITSDYAEPNIIWMMSRDIGSYRANEGRLLQTTLSKLCCAGSMKL